METFGLSYSSFFTKIESGGVRCDFRRWLGGALAKARKRNRGWSLAVLGLCSVGS